MTSQEWFITELLAVFIPLKIMAPMADFFFLRNEMVTEILA